MSELFTLFFNNLFPILLAAGIGFALAKWLNINPRPLSQVIFYVFSPVLVFNLIKNSQLSNQDILRTLALAILLMVCIGLLTWLIGGALRFDRRTLAAVMITAMFMNAIKGLLKFPAIYALSLGILFLQFGWKLPSGLDRSVTLLSNAAIPCMLVLLGMQLVNIRLDGHVTPLILTGSMRLLIAPAIAFGLTRLFGMTGTAQQAIVLEAGMPVAVLTTILATEFDAEPTFVTTAVLVTTLLSPLTLTPLLALLGA